MTVIHKIKINKINIANIIQIFNLKCKFQFARKFFICIKLNKLKRSLFMRFATKKAFFFIYLNELLKKILRLQINNNNKFRKITTNCNIQ